jgi:hypothetical protein
MVVPDGSPKGEVGVTIYKLRRMTAVFLDVQELLIPATESLCQMGVIGTCEARITNSVPNQSCDHYR